MWKITGPIAWRKDLYRHWDWGKQPDSVSRQKAHIVAKNCSGHNTAFRQRWHVKQELFVEGEEPSWMSTKNKSGDINCEWNLEPIGRYQVQALVFLCMAMFQWNVSEEWETTTKIKRNCPGKLVSTTQKGGIIITSSCFKTQRAKFKVV